MAEPAPRPRLADRGSVYVTIAALERFRAYLRAEGIDASGSEECRIELTRMLCDAHPVECDDGRDGRGYRYRSRTTGHDLSARVVESGGLAIVVSLHARRY